MISPKDEEEETIDRGNNPKAWSCERGKVQCGWDSGWKQGKVRSGWGSGFKCQCRVFEDGLCSLCLEHTRPRSLYGSFTSFRPFQHHLLIIPANPSLVPGSSLSLPWYVLFLLHGIHPNRESLFICLLVY